MGEAKRKKENLVSNLSKKAQRAFHLLKLISKYDDQKILRSIQIRKY